MSTYRDLQEQRNRVELLQLRIAERALMEDLGMDDDHNTLVAIQTIIDELGESNSKDVAAIKSMKRIENVMKLWDQKPNVSTDCNKRIKGLKSTIDMRNGMNEHLTRILDMKAGEIHGLETELSACKKDSEMLKRMVQLVRTWHDTSIRPTPVLNSLFDEIVDCRNAKEESDDTPIDEPEKSNNLTPMSKYRVNIDFVAPGGHVEDGRAVFLELP